MPQARISIHEYPPKWTRPWSSGTKIVLARPSSFQRSYDKSYKAKRANGELERENEGLENKVNSLVKTLRQDQNAKLADFEEMEKYRVGFEKTSGLIEAERERNNQACFHFSDPYGTYLYPFPIREP